jgi:hypothetical protein
MAEVTTPSKIVLDMGIDIDSTFGPEAQLTLALMRAELTRLAAGEAGTIGAWPTRPLHGEASVGTPFLPSAR